MIFDFDLDRVVSECRITPLTLTEVLRPSPFNVKGRSFVLEFAVAFLIVVFVPPEFNVPKVDGNAAVVALVFGFEDHFNGKSKLKYE